MSESLPDKEKRFFEYFNMFKDRLGKGKFLSHKDYLCFLELLKTEIILVKFFEKKFTDSRSSTNEISIIGFEAGIMAAKETIEEILLKEHLKFWDVSMEKGDVEASNLFFVGENEEQVREGIYARIEGPCKCEIKEIKEIKE